MAHTFSVSIFASKAATFNARLFRAPANVLDVDTFELDVQNTVNYFMRDRITSALARVNKRMETMDVSTASYDRALDRRASIQDTLDAFDDGATCGHSFVNGFACMVAWTVARNAVRKGDAGDVRMLRYSNELLNAIYDAENMDADAMNNLKLSVIGFMRYHCKNMGDYGKTFDIRFTDTQARELVHFANAHRVKWSKNTITARTASDVDIIEHAILSCLRKTFAWDVEKYTHVPTVSILN